MKKAILFFALLLSVSCTNGQSTKNVFSVKTQSHTDYKREGEWVAYDSKGKVISVSNYSSGILNGDYTEYSSTSNQILVEGQFKNGIRVGEWLYYNPTTALIDSIVTYSNGKILSIK
jgi:antitoxin component YwqK of YwqJK toxin-antitoxin module